MSEERYVVERLGTSNFPEWSLRTEAACIKKGYWTNIIKIYPTLVDANGAPLPEATINAERATLIQARDAQKMREARAELILRVEGTQLAHMTSEDPMIVWENLERIHLATGLATTLSLRRTFLTSKKLATETMESWISRVQKMVLRLQHAQMVVTEQDHILALTLGLPASYEAVIINFDATTPSTLTLNYVITRLLNEETRQLTLPASDAVSPSEIEEAMAFIRSRRAESTSAPVVTADLTCFFCDKKGHVKANCPERSAWEARKKKRAAGTAAAAQLDGVDSDGYDSEAW